MKKPAKRDDRGLPAPRQTSRVETRARAERRGAHGRRSPLPRRNGHGAYPPMLPWRFPEYTEGRGRPGPLTADVLALHLSTFLLSHFPTFPLPPSHVAPIQPSQPKARKSKAARHRRSPRGRLSGASFRASWRAVGQHGGENPARCAKDGFSPTMTFQPTYYCP